MPSLQARSNMIGAVLLQNLKRVLLPKSRTMSAEEKRSKRCISGALRGRIPLFRGSQLQQPITSNCANLGSECLETSRSLFPILSDVDSPSARLSLWCVDLCSLRLVQPTVHFSGDFDTCGSHPSGCDALQGLNEDVCQPQIRQSQPNGLYWSPKRVSLSRGDNTVSRACRSMTYR